MNIDIQKKHNSLSLEIDIFEMLSNKGYGVCINNGKNILFSPEAIKMKNKGHTIPIKIVVRNVK